VKRVTPRRVALLLFIAGLLVGSIVDRVPARSPIKAGEYSVLAGDFHVHGFPGDGALAPWALRQEAARAGLDVFALTNHNRVFTARFAEWLARSSAGPIVLAGEEITNPSYHLIAVGIRSTVKSSVPASAAIDAIHAQGGVAIAAHPGKRATGLGDEAIARLDGAERAHFAMHVSDEARIEFAEFFQRARALNPDIAPVGSSDFHTSPSLARCRTLLFVLEPTREGVLDAIRNGRTVAMDADGRLYGDSAFVRMAQNARPATRTDPHPVWRRISMILAWIGALGIVLFKGSAVRSAEL
jgi:predicted metal-dependent phosphoesterase TrpH